MLVFYVHPETFLNTPRTTDFEDIDTISGWISCLARSTGLHTIEAHSSQDSWSISKAFFSQGYQYRENYKPTLDTTVAVCAPGLWRVQVERALPQPCCQVV